MASPELSRRVEKVVGYPPLSEMGADQRREFHDALLAAGGFEDLPGKWQAAIVEAASRGVRARPFRATASGESRGRLRVRRGRCRLSRRGRLCVERGPDFVERCLFF